MKVKQSYLSLVLLMSGLSNGYADQYHYKDILIGDRASGFAGAYTAISDDPSGLYYNPAGITRAPDGQLSASANAYNQTTYKYSNINSSGKEWVRKSNGSIANFFGVFQPLAGGMFGFSIAAPDMNQASQNESFHDYGSAFPGVMIQDEVINYKEDDSTMLFGPSYALSLNNRFSIGATLYLHLRNAELEFRQDVKATDTETQTEVYRDILYQKYNTSEYALKPTLGLMWDVNQQLSIGATFAKTLMLSQSPMSQQFQANNYAAYVDENGDKQILLVDWNVPDPIGMQEVEDRELPFEASLGVAWFASPYFILSSDIDYFSETQTYGSVLNLSLGSEYFWSPQISTRFGVYTNNSNNKDLNTLVDGKRTTGYDVDETGVTLNISKHNRLSSMTFGINYAQGTGKAQLSPVASKMQDLFVQSMTAYIATSMNF